jgi:hypothetical protein
MAFGGIFHVVGMNESMNRINRIFIPSERGNFYEYMSVRFPWHDSNGRMRRDDAIFSHLDIIIIYPQSSILNPVEGRSFPPIP